MVVYNTKRTSLDEIELCLALLEIEYRSLIQGKSYKEISDILNNKYDISSSEEDINLLYEPTIDDMEIDLRIHFETMDLCY